MQSGRVALPFLVVSPAGNSGLQPGQGQASRPPAQAQAMVGRDGRDCTAPQATSLAGPQHLWKAAAEQLGPNPAQGISHSR